MPGGRGAHLRATEGAALRARLHLLLQQRGPIARYYNNPDADKRYYQTFLPSIRASQDRSGWDSTVSIRNLGGSAATVNLTLFKADGKVLDSRTRQALPANATWEIRPATIAGDWLIGDYNTWAGSAVVASDQDVAVVVRTEKSDRVAAYTGISTLNSGSGWGEPGTVLYLPVME